MFKLLVNILFNERGETLSLTRHTSNTLITAAAFNTNYTAMEAVVNALTATNLAADSVTAAKLNADVVRADYGLKQHTDGTLYVDVSDTNPSLEISDGGLRAKTDESTIERASGGLQIKDGGVVRAKIGADAIDGTKVADDSIDSEHYVAGSIDNEHLADSAVDTDEIADDAVNADKIDSVLDPWASKSNNTSYLAATDGFVSAYATIDGSGFVGGYTDSSNPPTTQRAYQGKSTAGEAYHHIMFPVKKGDYWKVIGATTVYWTPLGAA